MQRKHHLLLRLLLLAVAAGSLIALACGGGGGPDAGKTGTPGGTQAPAAGDLSDIPEDTTGITDTEIKLGSHMPLTGIAGIYGNAIVPGMQAYFDYINDTEGGVNGRKITLVVKDDAYQPPQTNQVVRELVEQDQIFAMASGLGTAQHSAVFEYLRDNHIPDLFIASGATKFTLPITRSAFGYNPNYVQEGTALGRYIVENYDGMKLGVLRQNDDFGEDGLKGIQAGISGSDVQIVDIQTYEAEETDMTSKVQLLRNAGSEVVVGYVLPRQAGSLVNVARTQLDWDVPIIVSGVVADQLTIALMNNGVKGTSEGVVTAAYLKPLETQGDAGIDKHKQIMEQYAPDINPSNITVYGQSVAELIVEVLKKAGSDLNRRSVVAAAESIKDFTCSVCFSPINLSATDHRPIEAFQLAKVQNDTWVPFGDIITYETTQ